MMIFSSKRTLATACGRHGRRGAIGVFVVAAVCVGALATPAPLVAQTGYDVFPARERDASSDAQQAQQKTKALVTLHVQDSTVLYVVRELAHQANLRLVYDKASPAFAKTITVHVNHMNVMDALVTVLRGTGLVVQVTPDGSTIMVHPRRVGSGGVQRQAVGVIRGHVTDSASGRGLSGATVKVQGIKLAALTSEDGDFVLRDVPVGDQLLSVHLFGFRPVSRTVTVTENATVTARIAMPPVPTVLSGVVTTATGQQRKIEVGNDITTLNVDSIRQVAPITSVTDLLESRVPGLTVLHSSGAPGDPSRLRLRGASSITGNNDPIVIVDGVRVYAAQSDARNANLAPTNGAGATFQPAAPSPIDQIDPASIETIEVFKGPSASSLYGSDAANGVIVITTKKGRAGPTHWSTTLGAGLNYMPGDWPTNYYRFGYGQSSGIGDQVTPFCDWNDLTCVLDSVVAFQALNNPRYTIFADHGSNQTADLTVSGGVPTLTYSLSGSAAGQIGILKLPAFEEERYQKFYNEPVPGWMRRPDKYTTYGGSGTLTALPNPGLTVTLSSSLFHSAQQRSSLEQALAQLQGTYISLDQLAITPLINNEFQRATDDQLSWTNGLSLNWRPVSWLPLTATGGLNSTTRTDESLIPYGIRSSSEIDLSGQVNDTTGSYGLGRGSSLVKTLNTGTTMPTLHGWMQTAVGFNVVSQSTSDVSLFTSVLSPGVGRPSTFPTGSGQVDGSNVIPPSQSAVSSSTYGWYVEPRLNVLSRFFISPGFRLDGGSASGSQAGLTGFPKLDLSYVAIDRQGERPLGGVLTFFRPHIAYGYAGTQPSPTAKLRLFCQSLTSACTTSKSVAVSLDGVTPVTSVFLTNLGNTQLRPERSGELEAGFDTYLWENRLQLTLTQHNKTTHDAIIDIPVASSVHGPATQSVNIGVVRNVGTELSLSTQLLQNQAIAWNVNANWSHNANTLVRLNPGFSPIIRADGTGIVPGYPLFGRWARPIVAYADVNHDGVLEPEEVKLGDSLGFVGSTTPKYEFAVNSNVTLGGRLSVNATISYENGTNQFNEGAQTSGAFARLVNQPGTSLETQAAVIAAIGRLQCGIVSGCSSAIGVMQSVSTLRFQTLSVNYALPAEISRVLRVPRASVALQGNNLGLHTNYRGKDPNVNAFATSGKSGDQVEDTGQLPLPRTWWLKFTLGN